MNLERREPPTPQSPEPEGRRVFKNWNEIQNLRREGERAAFLFLNSVDPETVFGQRVVEAFPEYFSDKEIGIPKFDFNASYKKIVTLAEEYGGDMSGAWQEFFSDTSISPIFIALGAKAGEVFGNEAIPLPEEIDADTNPGQTVEWNGGKFIVLSVDKEYDVMTLAPAEVFYK